jgi:hypothetical protein
LNDFKKDFNKTDLKNLTENKVRSLKSLFDAKNLTKKNKKSKKKRRPKYESEPISMPLGKFTFLTKPKPLYANIFEQFLSPFWTDQLREEIGFYIETWGRPLIDSDCSASSPMINIRTLKIGSDYQRETQDHSKWAISTSEDKALVCIGDLNHQSSQAKRGGSFMCIQDPEIYQ